MKSIHSQPGKKKNLLILLLLTSILPACSTTKVHLMTTEKFKPTRSVEILQQRPERPYLVIALLEGKSPKFDNGKFVFEKLRRKAQKIGGHAIIPYQYYQTAQAPIIRRGNATVPPDVQRPQKVNPLWFLNRPGEWGKAVVIRYTD